MLNYSFKTPNTQQDHCKTRSRLSNTAGCCCSHLPLLSPSPLLVTGLSQNNNTGWDAIKLMCPRGRRLCLCFETSSLSLCAGDGERNNWSDVIHHPQGLVHLALITQEEQEGNWLQLSSYMLLFAVTADVRSSLYLWLRCSPFSPFEVSLRVMTKIPTQRTHFGEGGENKAPSKKKENK